MDAIHNALAENKKIKFQYFQWNAKKEMELRHGGAYYHISPWGLSWDDENYYLIGFDSVIIPGKETIPRVLAELMVGSIPVLMESRTSFFEK